MQKKNGTLSNGSMTPITKKNETFTKKKELSLNLEHKSPPIIMKKNLFFI